LILTNFKKALPKTKENALLIDRLFKEYSNRFYAYLPEENRINSITAVSKYIVNMLDI